MRKPYQKSDLNAPRFRPKRTNILKKSLYNAFIEKYPKYADIDLVTFKQIIRTFNEELYHGIIENRDGVELPEGLGFVFMGTCPSAKKKNIDIAKSLEHGVVVEHKNWDSDNNLLKIFYTNHTSRYPLHNKQVWAFKAVKQFRKAASEAYKEDWPKYIVVDPVQKISALFAKMRKRDFIREDVKHIPDDYNEFKM
jgi:hypothetical protein